MASLLVTANQSGLTKLEEIAKAAMMQKL